MCVYKICIAAPAETLQKFFRYIYVENEKKNLLLTLFNPIFTFDLALDHLKKSLILTAVDYLIATSFPASHLTLISERSLHLYHWHPISQFVVNFHLLKSSLSRSHGTELMINRVPIPICHFSFWVCFVRLNMPFSQLKLSSPCFTYSTIVFNGHCIL